MWFSHGKVFQAAFKDNKKVLNTDSEVQKYVGFRSINYETVQGTAIDGTDSFQRISSLRYCRPCGNTAVSLTLVQTSVCIGLKANTVMRISEMRSTQWMKQLFNISPVYLGRERESCLRPIVWQPSLLLLS